MHLTRREFEELVVTALETVPEEFREKLENVEIIVEDRPTREDLADLDREPGTLLLGIYRGVPLTERGASWSPLYPDRIVLFQHSLQAICRTREEIMLEVRRTVLHEIAHHFGISDARLDELGC